MTRDFCGELLTLTMNPVIRNVYLVFLVVIVVGTATLTLSKGNGVTCGVLNKTAERKADEVQRFMHGDYPWIAALMHAASSPPAFFCGGTLISSTFVITGERKC